MKFLKYCLVLGLLLTGCTKPSKPQEEPKNESSALATLAEEQANLLVSSFGAMSVQYAVMDHGEIILSGQAGTYSKQSDQALSSEDIYAIGSVSKVYTATIAMKLQEAGKLDLDAPIINYLPTFTMKDERYTQITMRMLLNHSSGLPGSTFSNGFTFEADLDAHDSFLDNLANAHLQADPGAYSVYSNDSFLLAELVIEAIQQKSFTETLHEFLIEPLSLNNTKSPQDELNVDKMPRVVSSTNPNREFVGDYVNAIGTGGIYANAEDLCRFGQIFLDGSEVLSKESLGAMSAKEYLNGVWPQEVKYNTLGYGLGWDSVDLYPFEQNGIQALTKGGDTLFTHTALTVLPQHGLSVAVVTSGGISTYNQMMASALLEEVLKEKGVIQELKTVAMESVPETIVPLEDRVRDYAGLYALSTSLCTIQFDEEGNLLFASELAPMQVATIKHIGNGEFVMPGLMTDQKFKFEENDGKVYLVVEGISNIEGLGSTASTIYYAQKVEENPLDESVKAAWDARNGKAYYLVSEKAISQIFEMITPFTPISLSPVADGYISAHKIVDENNAVAVVQIPGTGSRDQFDYHFETVDGVEYLFISGDRYISQDAVSYAQLNETQITMADEAQWFLINEALDGKTLTVHLQGDAEIMVYDASMVCVLDTVIDDADSVVLSNGGSIVVLGSPNTQFSFSIE